MASPRAKTAAKATGNGRSTAALILAAGQGKRMRSSLPKVLHPCAGLPLIAHVVKLAMARKCAPIVVVVSPEGRRVRELLAALFPDAPLVFAEQPVPKGTGDAARCGLEAVPRQDGDVLILYGDVPLLTVGTIGRLEKAAKKADLALLTAQVADPTGYGRVVRNGGRGSPVVEVVEDKDASPAQREICEVNAGVYLCRGDVLKKAIGGLRDDNAQGELYLTDVVAAAAAGAGAKAVLAEAEEVRGVNSRAELAMAEATMRRRLIAHHQDRGVTFRDPDGTFVGAEVKLGRDVVVGVGVQLWGSTKVGDRTRLDGPTLVRDTVIGPDAVIHSFCHLERATVGRRASVGPFARLRPDAGLDEGARVGNFVEIKKAHIGKGSKINHLAYVGDAEVGAGSNVGAGTITCNYDGKAKHKTTLGKGVFVGSNSTLVAPVTLGRGVYVAAGSTITSDASPDSLVFGRARQVERKGYAVKLHRKLERKR